ncbi:integrase [Nostoc linckia z18]|uniref:Integrase n=2 Tax=Nostoc linckia TaxID=92942 RepID=A0A9Q5Z6A1_NOSLI|nr:tyrosine-type recombinase/integrase [Nostoc linckia]PHK30543.1 integrase [Nostoc linckia z15]PHK42309.1 integrase [Nostoc linckia z16]PHJ56037.1 integrase [Nostoc linckia z1]PHJ67641.1 integrase [Nostoc linckia z3]PHJ77172.1 integrase [Nostoc linckia z2]
MTDDDKWMNVDPRTNKLSIRFRVRGFPKQFYVSSGLKDTKRNREIVRIKRDAIANDITLGRFDNTLYSYQFRASAIAAPSILPPESEGDLGKLWEMFTAFQSKQIEVTTIYSTYRVVRNTIERLPSRSLSDAPKIRNWLMQNTSQFMASKYLLRFDQCCRWALDEEIIKANPFEKLKIKKAKNNTDDCLAFTIEQRDIIIEAFESDDRFCHYSNLLKFLFWTGCRHGEAFALNWKDVSEDCLRINISRSKNLLGIEKGTKNGKSRVFQCSPGSKLQNLLLSMKTDSSDSLLFLTKRGHAMTSSALSHAWNRDGKNQIGVVRSLSNNDNKKVPYLNPYATRHTFATWAVAVGISPDRVAYLIGDDINTVLRYYVHPEATKGECPDF